MLARLPVNSSFAPPIQVRNQDTEHRPTAHKWAFMGSHCCNIWGACECGGQGAYWWVCLLAPLTFTRLTENVSECQMLALVMMQLLKSLSYWSTASLPSPNSRLLSPCPFTCLFSLTSSSPSLLLACARATDTCQRSEVIGLNNGSYAHTDRNSQHLLSFLSSAGIALAVFRHEKEQPCLTWVGYISYNKTR